MRIQGQKVLITGADGFIGSHLTEELVRKGNDVRAFVFYNSLNSWGWLDQTAQEIKNELEVFEGDIRDPYRVKESMKGCTVIFHLASLIAIPYSYHSPASYIDTNIKGTLHVLQAARELQVEKLVHTSTSEVYGSAQFIPIHEEHPLQAQSPYAASKIGADQIALSYYYSFQTPVAIIRPFNTYGPRQSARAVIPTIITQVASGQKKIKLGAIYPTRDFNYIKDTVEGFIRIAEAEQSVGEIINIGSSYEISIGDTAQLIAETMNTEIEIETEEERLRPLHSEVERLCADHTKAKQLINWEPRYAGREGLKKGLQETIDWFINPDNLKVYKSGRYNI